MTANIRRLPALLLVMVFGLASPFALADHDDDDDRDDDRQEQRGPVKGSIVDKLLKIDGAQAVVAAVLVVDEAKVLDFSLVELLSNRRPKVVLFAPTNSAFENLLGLDAGSLSGLSATDIAGALPGILTGLGLDANAVAAILLKHASLNSGKASEARLLKRQTVEVADGSVFPVSVGAAGVEINRETTVIKADIFAKNGVIHFIDTVILDGLLGP